MRTKTDVWDSFTDWQQIVIRKLLRLSPAQRKAQPDEYRALLREYWRKHRRRSRDRLPSIKDHRQNSEYRAWLRSEKLPVKYSRKTYEQWRKEVACKS